MHTKIDTTLHKTSKTLVTALLFAAGTSWAQQTTPAATAADAAEEEVIILSPFEVSAEEEQGYMAATTLAGNRLNTELRDIGNAVTVITSQFLTDIGATSNESLLQYTVGTEVGNVFGNFAGTGDGAFLNESGRFVNPNNNTRVRGLTAADNTRDYFLTNVPWDSYNVDRVDLQRGPNSILFGQGSPAGIINVGTKQARFRNANEAEVRVTDEGGIRGTLDINRVLLKDELAFRIIGLYNDEQFKQKPAYAIDKRLYSAVRYEPKLLKRGNARTILKGNYEVGEISSNRPRQLPPIDRITPWFQSGTYQGRNNRNEPYTYNHLNRLTLNGSQAQDDNTSLPNHGQQRPSYNGGPLGGTPNLYYNPMLGNFGQQFGNPLGYVDGTGDGGVNHYWTAEPRFPRAIGPSGAIDGNLGNPYQRPLGVASYGDFAKNARLPFAEFGIYKNKNLTDPSVFDFYNNLLEGPNKKEWRHFRIYNFSLAQTFFNDKMGIELTYNNERDRSGQLSMLNGQNQAIYIDIMSVYADGTNRGTGTPNQSWNKVTGEPFQDGTPNPNLGRPFLNDNPSGNESVQDRENKRATVFVTHDFEKEGSDNLFGRILGKHTLTGLYGEDRNKSDSRNWARYSTDVPTLKNFLFGPNNTTNWDANEFRPMPVVYLGPSLLSSSTAVGANIPNPSVEINMMGGGLRTFDSTWNRPTNPTAAGYVNPAAFWGREYYPADQGPYNSTQSENPANYIGWRDISLPVYDSEQGYRDFNTQGATLRKDTLTSKAITWQGHFWNNALVGTYGYREDTAKSWSYNRNVNTSGNYQDNRMNLSPAVYKLPDAPSNRVDVISRAYTIVAHLNDMPFLDGLTEKLPILVSLFYNNSTNFQPAAQRVDVYGEPHPAPQGETTDAGILLETRDGKYTLKINKYETTATNATSSAMSNPGFIGTAQQYGARWANRFEFNWTQDTNAGAVTPNDPTNNQYNYGLAPGETLEQAQAREAGVIAAWRAWQKSVDPRFGPAWRFDYSNPAVNPSVSQPSGFTLTEDAVSEGYEIELSALPTKNWRLALNAAQSEARRTNIGDANIQAFVKSFETALRTTPAGDLRIWWGGAGNDTILKLWNESFGSEWVQRRLQEGSNVPELREWRLNAISNYEFDHGALKGFNFGAGVRYQSDVIIGYKPLPGATANEISFDLEDPYKGPAETNLDLWVGYRRMISRNVEWHVQLNVRNAFEGDDLIPINVQPDGSAAGYRIAPYQTFTLSNRFTF